MTNRMIERQAQHAKKLLDRRPRMMDDDCLFCAIIAGKQPCYKVYEDEDVLAFLDVLPISRGHTLVIPRSHYARLDHMDEDTAGSVGRAMPRIARAIGKAVNQPDYTVVSNRGYCQVVHHVHFHIVPAPKLNEPKPSKTDYPDNRSGELDDDEGEEVAASIRKQLEEESRARL